MRNSYLSVFWLAQLAVSSCRVGLDGHRGVINCPESSFQFFVITRVSPPAYSSNFVRHFERRRTRPPLSAVTGPGQTVLSSSISAMKAKSNAGSSEAARHFQGHIRKGGAGGWRDVMTVRQSELMDKLYLEQMKDAGLKMDFGEGLSM